jgi:hypothetical protein
VKSSKLQKHSTTRGPTAYYYLSTGTYYPVVQLLIHELAGFPVPLPFRDTASRRHARPGGPGLGSSLEFCSLDGVWTLESGLWSLDSGGWSRWTLECSVVMTALELLGA